MISEKDERDLIALRDLLLLEDAARVDRELREKREQNETTGTKVVCDRCNRLVRVTIDRGRNAIVKRHNAGQGIPCDGKKLIPSRSVAYRIAEAKLRQRGPS